MRDASVATSRLEEEPVARRLDKSRRGCLAAVRLASVPRRLYLVDSSSARFLAAFAVTKSLFAVFLNRFCGRPMLYARRYRGTIHRMSAVLPRSAHREVGRRLVRPRHVFDGRCELHAPPRP